MLRLQFTWGTYPCVEGIFTYGVFIHMWKVLMYEGDISMWNMWAPYTCEQTLLTWVPSTYECPLHMWTFSTCGYLRTCEIPIYDSHIIHMWNVWDSCMIHMWNIWEKIYENSPVMGWGGLSLSEVSNCQKDVKLSKRC